MGNYNILVLFLQCNVGGAFLAGWPFAHAVELYGWTTAYYLLEAAGAAMVGLVSYLVMLLVRGLAANRAAQKQN